MDWHKLTNYLSGNSAFIRTGWRSENRLEVATWNNVQWNWKILFNSTFAFIGKFWM